MTTREISVCLEWGIDSGHTPQTMRRRLIVNYSTDTAQISPVQPQGKALLYRGHKCRHIDLEDAVDMLDGVLLSNGTHQFHEAVLKLLDELVERELEEEQIERAAS